MKTFDEVVEFHGHACPGLALGYRVSIRALKELAGRAEDEEIVAVVENNSCAVDAVQVMTGCTFGKGNLIFRDYGKQVYTFIRRPSGKSIRISVVWNKPEETEAEKRLWDRYIRGDRSKKIITFVHDRKAARIVSILNADDKEVLGVMKGTESLPPEAAIYPTLVCDACAEKVMEPRARLKNGQVLCIPCFERKK